MKNEFKLTTEQMELLKEKEIELLKIFITVCDELNLNYFIVQGTLLGAVRHQGFIPWDDDIDVGMFRKDYNIFLKKASEYIPDGFFLQTHETDPAYFQCFAKLRNTNTTFLETTCKNLKMNHGIYIDIFPFDYYPDQNIASKIFNLKKLLIRYRLREMYYIPSDHTFSFKNILRSFLKLASKCCFPTEEEAFICQEKMLNCLKSGKHIINNGSPWGMRECVPAKWLQKTILLKFEGILVKAPAMYDQYLTHVYGDYMKLPPKNQRIPHHYISAIDFEHSYQRY